MVGSPESFNLDESGQFSNQVSEQAREQAAEDARQASAARQATQSDQARNQKFAKFLEIILAELHSDEKLLHTIFLLFFKIKNPTTNIFHKRKSMNTPVLCGFFFPFHQQQATEIGLAPAFSELRPSDTPATITNYLSYLKKLAAKFHDDIPLDPDTLLETIFLIFAHYRLAPQDALTHKKSELMFRVKSELFATEPSQDA